MLKENDIEPEQVSSFNTNSLDEQKVKAMIKKFDQDIDSSDLDGFEGLVKKLAEDKDDQKSIIVFFDALVPRVLHDAQATEVPEGGSLMFQNYLKI